MSSEFQYGRWLASPPPGEEVVISGVSGRVPECHHLYEFRDKLFSKTEMISANERRWKLDHREIPKRSGTILGVDHFDAGFFGLHHRQADIMDPVMRKYLETALEAVFDAGVNPKDLQGTRTGVFVGLCWSDIENITLVNVSEPERFALTGYYKSMIAHRVSYFLKLKGPAFIIDTACSSSMNALDAAFKALRSGKCDSAIVGGANLILHPGSTLQFSRLGVLSSDGVCKVFDQDADGYVRAESVTSVFLQKAKNSRRIYARIISTKANTDGYKPEGITFPSASVQKILMSEIYEESGVEPSQLSFLEAHGTGTTVGDPQEAEALDDALAKKRDKPLLVGSVKCSIGHTEPGSGFCSIFKLILAMESGLIAPNINIKKIKAGMEGFEQGRMVLVTELTKLEDDAAIVGVNNFGFGGNNAHAILKRFNKRKLNGGLPEDDLPRLVCVSGRTEAAVMSVLEEINSKPLDAEYVALIHQIYKRDVTNHFYRGYTIVSKTGPIKTSTALYNYHQAPLYVLFGELDHNFKKLASQLSNFPVFKNALVKINAILGEKHDGFLGGVAVQLAIADLLKTFQIHPSGVYGDSCGKLACAYYYDAASLEDILSGINQKNLTKTVLGFKSLLDAPKNAVILNISDKRLNCRDVFVANGDVITFLDILGSLYEQGHNPHLDKLYPPVQFPVSRGTPMIAPSIRWRHDKAWHVFRFTNFTTANINQEECKISYLYEEFRFLWGHVIDGRQLFPATEYLNLVWNTFASGLCLMKTSISVVFENCKFIRAVTLPQSNTSGMLMLLVSIQKGTGLFEILEKGSVVVSGRIRVFDASKHSKIELKPICLDDTQVLEQEEIYRELYLRGYGYSGLFKGIVKCNLQATSGLIKWEDNWSAFMDKMLQLKILQIDSRLLYVPIGIRRLSIDVIKHNEAVSKLDPNEPFLLTSVYNNSDTIKAGGIEISGLQARPISKRKPRLDPVLEKYEFVPNTASVDLATAIRINTQIILENSLEYNFKAVEMIDDSTHDDADLLLPLVCKVLDDVPVVTPNLTISTKKTLEDIPGVKIEPITLTPENQFLLIVGTKLLRRSNLQQILVALNAKGFVLSREDLDFEAKDLDNLTIVTAFETPHEKLVLVKVAEQCATTFVEVSSNNWQWLPELQKALKTEENIVVYSCNNQEGLLGLVNCLRREPGGNKVKGFFFMDPDAIVDPRHYPDQLTKNLAMNVYKSKTWGTYRHLLLEELAEIEVRHSYGNVTALGDLSTMKWISGALTEDTPLPPNHVLVYPYYASVNFKDIMLATGRINVGAIMNRLKQNCVLGFEFSGRDAKGRRVCGMVSSFAMSSFLQADREFMWMIPDKWSMKEAATVPVVYATVLYGLRLVARIKPGESILIHSATGGIGLAALNICLHYKCNIFVTVGTQEKRDFLKQHYPQIPESHIGNSRDTSFETMINTETDHKGVDIVLNSLSEDKLMASVRCLARGGRFIEIGKFDLANDASLDLLLLEKGASYHGVMLDTVINSAPQIKRTLSGIMQKAIDSGLIKPLPVTEFGRNEIEAAYRHMMTGKHIGKVVVKIRDEEKEKVVVPKIELSKAYPRFNCLYNGTYVIIGGLGGVGMELADWLVLRGATKLVLVSRSGVQTGYQTQRIGIWKSYGVVVEISTKDITTKQGCLELIEDASKLGQIDAIFNLGVVLKDALFEDQTEDNFLVSFGPKAQATKYLDEITRQLCPGLRHFVIFSSVSCGRGNPGQSNYGMSNSIMERICEKRKQDGFPAVAIQWGAIGEVGLVAKMQKENRELVIGGTLQQKISSCMDAMDKFLNQGHPIVSSMVVAEKQNRGHFLNSAVETVAHVLGIKDLKSINQQSTLAELGMDSIMGTEIVQLLEKEFEIYLTAKDLRTLTFAKLIEMEAEHKSGGKATKDKAQPQVIDLLLQFLPTSKKDQLSITKLESQLQNDEPGQLVFVLAGIEGMFHPLEPLTKNLKAHVYGLEYNYNNPEDTVEEIAATVFPHLEERLSVDQSFTLLCYSFGAIVGVELVKLLESKHHFGKIVLIDGSPTYLLASLKQTISTESEAEFETDILTRIAALVVPLSFLSQHREMLVKCGNFDERIELLYSLLPEKFLDREKLDKQGAVALNKRFKALLKYQCDEDNQIKSKTHLFKAKHPLVDGQEEDYQLLKVCECLVGSTTIEGDHGTMLQQPELLESVQEIINS